MDGITDLIDEFEQALEDGEGQESLACCSPWGCKESDTIERLINKKTVGEMESEKMGRCEPEKESQVDRRGRLCYSLRIPR